MSGQISEKDEAAYNSVFPLVTREQETLKKIKLRWSFGKGRG
jgi:hypothetical protein